MELLSKLGIDWKLLIAQIVNFTILLVVLLKFAYKPVIGALDRRTKMIEKSIHDAHEASEKLKNIEKMEKERMSDAHKQIGALLEKAKSEAEEMKKGIVDEARRASDDMLARTHAQLKEEKASMLAEAKAELSNLVIAAASKLLEREYSAADQKRLAEAVSKEMHSAK